MSKVMLIMDMPESCIECNFLFCDIEDDFCEAKGKIREVYLDKYKKPDWCPLREVPHKTDFRKAKTETVMNWIEGYNACIDKIMKGSEENEID